jgi:integrase
MRERSPGCWDLRVFVGQDPVTGKLRYTSRTFRGGKRAASSELAKLVSTLPTEQPQRRRAQAKMSLSDLIDTHIDRHAGSPTTIAEYRAAHNRYIRPLVGRLPIAELDAGTLDHFYEHLVRKRGLSPSTVRQVHAIIRGACSRAVKWGWLKSNPARDASPPTVRRREPDIPSVAAVAAAIRAAEEANPPFGLFLRLAAATGGRRGELCSLTWAHVSLADSTLRIETSTFSERGGNSVVKDTKNHSKRLVSLDGATTQSLAEHHKLMAERASVCGVELTDRSFVFSNDADGQTPWRPDYVTGAWTRLRKSLGLDHVRLHDLRHFQATMLLQSGTSVKDVSKRIGHRDAATTLNVYAHVLESTDRRSADVIGDLLDGSTPAVPKSQGRRSRATFTRASNTRG